MSFVAVTSPAFRGSGDSRGRVPRKGGAPAPALEAEGVPFRGARVHMRAAWMTPDG